MTGDTIMGHCLYVAHARFLREVRATDTGRTVAAADVDHITDLIAEGLRLTWASVIALHQMLAELDAKKEGGDA